MFLCLLMDVNFSNCLRSTGLRDGSLRDGILVLLTTFKECKFESPALLPILAKVGVEFSNTIQQTFSKFLVSVSRIPFSFFLSCMDLVFPTFKFYYC